MLTKPFEAMAEMVLAYYETDRPLPTIVLDHPTQNLPPEQLAERVEQLVDATIRLLDGQVD